VDDTAPTPIRGEHRLGPSLIVVTLVIANAVNIL
jgi:hypothetical protein